MRSARAFAPATVANLGPGLDILGLAVEGPGDEVQVDVDSGSGITVAISGFDEVPRDPDRNTAAIAAREILRRSGRGGLRMVLEVRKGLPVSAGQGGSAASAAAAAVAADEALEAGLSRVQLLDACLEAEQAVAGRHADNAAPALWGGVVLVRSIDPCDIVALRYPASLRVVLALPAQRLSTRQARSALPASVSREAAVRQAAQVGAVVAALAAGDFQLLARAVEDCIAEPVRSGLLPGFTEAKRAALAAGACGCSISGAGPTAFAFAASDEDGQRIADAMVSAYRDAGVAAAARVCAVDSRGARLQPAGRR